MRRPSEQLLLATHDRDRLGGPHDLDFACYRKAGPGSSGNKLPSLGSGPWQRHGRGMTTNPISTPDAAAARTRRHGDRTINRVGLGAVRFTHPARRTDHG
jgi:hypothetical protein